MSPQHFILLTPFHLVILAAIAVVMSNRPWDH